MRNVGINENEDVKRTEKKLTVEEEAFLLREATFTQRHKNDTDEQLLEYIRSCSKRLGHIPRKREIEGYTYIKNRLGPWPRVLEKAGLKERRAEKIGHRNAGSLKKQH